MPRREGWIGNPDWLDLPARFLVFGLIIFLVYFFEALAMPSPRQCHAIDYEEEKTSLFPTQD